MTPNENDDWLEALYTIGIILFATPILLSLLTLLLTMPIPGGVEVDSGAFAIGTIETTGLIAIVYATIKKRRKRRSHKT